jgi:outer membrane protein assembly factor BamB
MKANVRLSRLVTALLFGSTLAACGGGGAGSSTVPSAGGSSLVPAPPNPNISSSDVAYNWTNPRYDPSGSGDNVLQTAITEQNVATLKPSWVFVGTVGSLSSVAVDNGVVYRTEEGANTYAISESTGAQLWNYVPPNPEGFDASPLVAGGYVYFPSVTGRFLVVNAQSGTGAFSYPTTDAWGPLIGGTQERAHYRGSPVYYGGTIYSVASNQIEPGECMQGGQLITMDPLSPTLHAVASLTPNGTTGVGVWSSPVFDASGGMYVATGNSCSVTNAPYGDSMLRVNSSTLSIVWNSAGPPDADDLDFGATPVVASNEVIDGAKDGNVYAYDTSSGQQLWKQSAFPNGAIMYGLATDGTYVAVPYEVSSDREHGGIAVFDLHGNLKWSYLTGTDPNYPGKGVMTPPAISQGMLFVGYVQPNCTANCDGLGAFDLATGKPLWFYSTPTPIFGGVVVVQGGVFASEVGDANLYCFLPATGAGSQARIIHGTHNAGFAYYHNPWVKNVNVAGDNTGPLSP